MKLHQDRLCSKYFNYGDNWASTIQFHRATDRSA